MSYKLVMLLPSPILITDEPEQVEIGNWYYKGGTNIEGVLQDIPNYKLPKIIAGGIQGLPNLVNNLPLEDSHKIKWFNPHVILKNIQASITCFDDDYPAYEKGFIEGFNAVVDFYKVCFTLKDINDAFNAGKNYDSDNSIAKNSLQSILEVKIHRVDVHWECSCCGGHDFHKLSCKSLTREERIILINKEIMVQKLL